MVKFEFTCIKIGFAVLPSKQPRYFNELSIFLKSKHIIRLRRLRGFFRLNKIPKFIFVTPSNLEKTEFVTLIRENEPMLLD